MSDQQFEIVNPAALKRPNYPTKTGCGRYADAPVCTDGSTDVACTGEIYRGCYPGTVDCANDPDGNNNDRCCFGWGPGNGDNIDHADCYQQDAPYGGISLCRTDRPGCDSDPPKV